MKIEEINMRLQDHGQMWKAATVLFDIEEKQKESGPALVQ